MIKIDDKEIKISRKNIALLFLTAVPGSIFNTIQLQKGIFLLSKNLSFLFEENYDFVVGSYGPCSSSLHEDITLLVKDKLAKILRDDASYTSLYVATHQGFEYIKQYDCHPYIEKVVRWILPLTMGEIISSILKVYPEYKN